MITVNTTRPLPPGITPVGQSPIQTTYQPPQIQSIPDIIRTATTPLIDRKLSEFITQDSAMQKLKTRIRILAHEEEPVLIQGPTGSGKEIIAKCLAAGRPKCKMHTINCANLPEKIIHSILFGHQAGSFSGATATTEGVLRAASHGTVFLDEIGKLSLNLQGLLLRAIEYHEVTPVGSTETVPINCRFIAAAKENLEDLVNKGTFLEDLYGRIYTHTEYVTGLKDRVDDINYIARYAFGYNSPIPETEYEAGTNIFRYNVRGISAYVKRRELDL